MTRAALIVAGALVMAYAALGILLDPDVRIAGVLIFMAVVLVLHDGVFMPLLIAITWAIRKGLTRLPGRSDG